MNIVFVNPEYPSPSGHGHGGIATYIYTMASALDAMGHTTHVLIRDGVMPDQLRPGVTFHSFGFNPPKGLVSAALKRFRRNIYWERGCSRAALHKVMELHATTRLDAVEIPEYGGLAYEFRRSLPFPVIMDFHTPTVLTDELNQVSATRERRQWYQYEARAVRNATASRCPSKALRARLQDLYNLPEQDVELIRNPLSTRPFDAVEKKPSSTDRRYDILFAGRLERRKGAEVMARVIRDILGIDPQVHVTFAGETEIGASVGYRQAIERAIPENDRKRVWFLGPVSRSHLLMLYRRSDLFLMPSLFENAPYSLMEAMAARLPVVASDAGGISEMVTHRKNGLLFSLGDLNGLPQAVVELFENPGLAGNLADSAHETIKSRFAPEVVARQSLELYARSGSHEPQTKT